MKCIGHKTGPSAWTRPLANPTAETPELYIADPPMVDVGPKEYKRIGWVLPKDAEASDGGEIYETREETGRNGVPCYIKRAEPAERSPMDDARERITALEKAFVMLTSQSADVIEAQRASIERLSAQIKEVHAYAGSLERVMRSVTGKGSGDERRWQAALAALSGLRGDAKDVAAHAYRIADAMIAADVPTTDQAHTD